VTVIRVTASTMGQSSPASVSSVGWYRWRKMPGWTPNDPRCQEETASDPAVQKAEKAARLAEFAGYLGQGLTAQQAGRLIGLSPKTSRTYERELRQQEKEAQR
jgi:hypothetical protein